MDLVSALRRALFVGAVAGLLIGRAEPAVAETRAERSGLDRWEGFVSEASRRFGIPITWICDVMRAESAGRDILHGRPIVSTAGAMGLMQIMPATWAALRARYGLGDDPYDPRDNIFAGAAYLRELYDRFGYPNLFAAYNAGPGRFDISLRTGISLPGETQDYLAKIAQGESAHGVPVTASGRGLFFNLRSEANPAASPSTFPVSSAEGLFVHLRTGSGYR